MSRIRRKVFECDGHQMPVSNTDRRGWPDWLIEALVEGRVRYTTDATYLVKTKEGPLHGVAGGWIIRGKDGELWPVAEDIFPNSYEVIE